MVDKLTVIEKLIAIKISLTEKKIKKINNHNFDV